LRTKRRVRDIAGGAILVGGNFLISPLFAKGMIVGLAATIVVTGIALLLIYGGPEN
jgi:hypothetical protein